MMQLADLFRAYRKARTGLARGVITPREYGERVYALNEILRGRSISRRAAHRRQVRP